MFRSDTEILDEIILTKNLQEETIQTYRHAITYYKECNNMTLQELLEEADQEEINCIRLRERKVKQRLLNYKQYLLTEKNYKNSSVNLFMSKIKAVYNFYELELPRLPSLKSQTQTSIKDIPDLNDIKFALENTNNISLQAMILFMLSSGCSRNEVLNLTVQDFIDATVDYHQSNSIHFVLEQLLYKENIIPLFYIHRQKVNFYYYTCCSNEAVQKICLMLKQRDNLNNNDKLFDIPFHYVKYLFQRLNDDCKFGFRGSYRFFRPHTLRKRFQTELAKAKVDVNYYEHMIGHRRNSISETYIKIDPETVRTEYKRVVDKLCVYEKVNYIEVDSEDKKELQRLRQELKQIKAELDFKLKMLQ